MSKKRVVEEYDVGASSLQKSLVAPSKSPVAAKSPTASSSRSPTSGSSLHASDLLNPFKLSVTRIKLKRNPNQPFGFDVKMEGNDVFRVTNVIQGQPGALSGIENDSYLISIDGKRVTSEAEVKLIEKSNRNSVYIALAKKRPSPLDASSFPLPESVQRIAGRQYLLFRLDPTDGKKVGTGIGERDGTVIVTTVLDNSAGSKAGVQVGDRILAVDGTRVLNRETCRKLVQDSMGNPFDMIVERGAPLLTSSPKVAPTPAPGPTSPSQSAPTSAPMPAPAPVFAPAPAPQPPPPPPPPPPPDPNAGDPSSGIPTVPTDVSVLLDSKAKKTLNYIRMVPKKEKQPKQVASIQVPAKKVTLSKTITKTKLKQ